MNEPIPHSDEVNTDAQLAELNRMSFELQQRLSDMIIEQEQRVQAFTQQQHSLSALPQPALPTDDAPECSIGYSEPAPSAKHVTPPPTKPLSKRPPDNTPPPLPFNPNPSKASLQKQESTGCSWPGIVALFIIFILLKNCG